MPAKKPKPTPRPRKKYARKVVAPRRFPPSPHAACPKCGAVVRVIPLLDFELVSHRTPMPESVVCQYPIKVKPEDVSWPDPPVGR